MLPAADPRKGTPDIAGYRSQATRPAIGSAGARAGRYGDPLTERAVCAGRRFPAPVLRAAGSRCRGGSDAVLPEMRALPTVVGAMAGVRRTQPPGQGRESRSAGVSGRLEPNIERKHVTVISDHPMLVMSVLCKRGRVMGLFTLSARHWCER